MIKVESDMLVLDSSFTKEDVLAINEFIEISKRQEREAIVDIIRKIEYHGMTHSEICLNRHYMAEDIVDAISGRDK
jgi:autonomous glycyl radical cofactor GrcA